MNNHDIDLFFESNQLAGHVEKTVAPSNEIWDLTVGPFPCRIQTQENANRMRIFTQITTADQLEPQHLENMLEANFHSALDARYAMVDGIVTALYLHPLAELTLEQFVHGFYQVVSCSFTFGDDYTGGTLTFGRPKFRVSRLWRKEEPEGTILDQLVAVIRDDGE